MKLSEHKELKIEILALPPKEKDKLLLRLVAKDKVLTEHLHFLLLEDESNLRDRVSAIKDHILQTMQNLKSSKNNNAKEVLTILRKLAKAVNHNFRVTKTNFEDVELRIFLFNNTTTKFKSGVFSAYKNYEQLFGTYFVKATLITLRKFYKLHEDLQYDLKDDMNKLLAKIYTENMAGVANNLGLPEQI
ncbi:hypothetical protein FA048_19045 [Pedobacter polaris]|uniref:Uncharacterized protein n=1 Tax=Pedobacter polaris TaxID=2571273 RepID=A0A4U1CET9_9SPHI|nr:hypothetical protein [Pedobacter polaris]TKC04779.1 hypothetical protein FA048_19045 [Pedobacter polaris]